MEEKETKSNPADEGSHGISVHEIMSSKWISGPEFLWKNEDQWPQTMKTQEEVSTEPSEQDPEVKRSITMATVAAPEVPFADHMMHFSDWFRAKKSVALCLCYLRKLKKRSYKDNESLLSHRKEVNGVSYAPITVEGYSP